MLKPLLSTAFVTICLSLRRVSDNYFKQPPSMVTASLAKLLLLRRSGSADKRNMLEIFSTLSSSDWSDFSSFSKRKKLVVFWDKAVRMTSWSLLNSSGIYWMLIPDLAAIFSIIDLSPNIFWFLHYIKLDPMCLTAAKAIS